MPAAAPPLHYDGAAWLRQRLVLATLSGRAVRVDHIRDDAPSSAAAASDEPGVRPFEVALLRLLEKITNGSHVEINATGTTVLYRPGVIVGGSGLVHDCGTEARALGRRRARPRSAPSQIGGLCPARSRSAPSATTSTSSSPWRRLRSGRSASR